MIKTTLILPVNIKSEGIYLKGEFEATEGNKTLCVYIKSYPRYGNVWGLYGNVWAQKDDFNMALQQLGEGYGSNDNAFIINSLTTMFKPLYDDVWVVIGERTDDDPTVKWVLQVHEESGAKPNWLYHFADEFIYP